MKKYVLYAWCADDEGGLDMCLAECFTPSTGYHPESGWRARPSEYLGKFNTVEEMAEIIRSSDPDWYKEFEDEYGYDNAMEEAKNIWHWYHVE